MRAFLCLLLGSAAVVGFEATFGLWKPERLTFPPRPYRPRAFSPGTVVLQHFSSRDGVKVLDAEVQL